MAQPSHIVVAQDQTVWMSDPTLNRLVQFNLNGLFLTSWGAAGNFPGAFNNPHHFDVDQDGNLYSSGLRQLQGAKIRTKAECRSTPIDPTCLCVDQWDEELRVRPRARSDGALRRRFRSPYYIYLYLSDAICF